MLNRFNHRVGLLLALSLAVAPPALAQEGPVEACCFITAFDRRTGIVTASDGASGQSFQFIATPNQRRSIKVGHKLWANFDTQKVSVDGVEHCCGMVNVTATTAGQVRRQAKPAEPAGAAGGVQR